MARYVGNNSLNAIDLQGLNLLQLAYYAVMIGIGIAGLNVTSPTLPASVSYTLPKAYGPARDLYGVTDMSAMAGTQGNGGAGGCGKNTRKCPDSGGQKSSVFGSEHIYQLAGFFRKVELILKYSYSGGNLNASVVYHTNGDLTWVGFQVEVVTASIATKQYECECKKYLPCFEGHVQMRTVADQIGPWNSDYSLPYGFRICADGSKWRVLAKI